MWSLIAALSAVLASPREEAGFRQLQERTFRLVDVTAVSGVDFRHETGATGEKYMTETMGSGVVFFDYDADGDPDLLFINGGDDPTGERAATSATSAAALYRNDGHGSFTDVTRAAGLEHIGYGMGATAGDYDNDGEDDLYVTNYGPNVLFRNSGDGTFSDVTTESGVGNSQWSASATWADLDNDGHLDLYVTNYVDFSLANNPICRQMRDGNEIRAYCLPDAFRRVADEIYRNRGDGTFESAGSRAGIALPSGKGLGVVSLDYDHDGLLDIYVANDTSRISFSGITATSSSRRSGSLPVSPIRIGRRHELSLAERARRAYRPRRRRPHRSHSRHVARRIRGDSRTVRCRHNHSLDRTRPLTSFWNETTPIRNSPRPP